MSFLVIFFILITTLGLWLILSRYSLSNDFLSSDSIDEEGFIELPLRDVFLDFDHESTKAWLTWIDTQDESKKQIAYEKLVQYLDLPPKKLGVITADVVKAIIVFKLKLDSFDVLANLITKCRNHYQQFKTIDLFYELAAIGLVKIDQNKAEKFLIDELNNTNRNSDLIEIQKYLVKAIAHLDLTYEVENIWIKVLMSNEYSPKVKKELINQLDTKSAFIQEKIYFKSLENFVASKTTDLSENEKFTFEQILSKSRNFLNEEGSSSNLWYVVSKACDNSLLQEITVKVLVNIIGGDQSLILPEQLLELLAKPEPLRTVFAHACMKKFEITEDEKDLLKIQVKEEDLNFDCAKINFEKNKKTKSISPELLGQYHNLEKIIANSEGGLSGMIIAFIGSAREEKLYLLRAYAANNNKSFVYIDVEKILTAVGIVKELKNHILQVKPCLVYLDNLDKTLNVNLDKKSSQNLKSILKTVKELALVPSMDFIGNIAISEQELEKISASVLVNLVGNNPNRVELNKPTKEEKERILQRNLAKIDSLRIADSENFSFDQIVAYFGNIDLLNMLRVLHRYLEISLLAYGRLISLDEFKKHEPDLDIVDVDNAATGQNDNHITQEGNQANNTVLFGDAKI